MAAGIAPRRFENEEDVDGFIPRLNYVATQTPEGFEKEFVALRHLRLRGREPELHVAMTPHNRRKGEPQADEKPLAPRVRNEAKNPCPRSPCTVGGLCPPAQDMFLVAHHRGPHHHYETKTLWVSGTSAPSRSA